MPTRDYERLRLPRPRRSPLGFRLWREWCFARVVWRHSRANFLLLLVLLCGGALLFQWQEPEKQLPFPKAVFFTWTLLFGEAPEDYPAAPVLQVMFFLVPLVGLLVIIEGLVDFALLLRDRRRSERSWCKIMAAALSNHIVLVGLGKLGYRSYRLLRRLGEPVVVIEGDVNNQFLEEIRRDGVPLLIGDARREELLVDANIGRARSIIVATNDDLANLEVALDARRLNPAVRVVLRMFDQNMADKIREGFNIKTAMSQSAISAPAFVTAALDASIVSSQVVGDELLVLQQWSVASGGPLAGKTVAEAMTTFGINVVQRQPLGGPARVLPPPMTRLEIGDQLLVQGTFTSLALLRGKLAPAGERGPQAAPVPSPGAS